MLIVIWLVIALQSPLYCMLQDTLASATITALTAPLSKTYADALSLQHYQLWHVALTGCTSACLAFYTAHNTKIVGTATLCGIGLATYFLYCHYYGNEELKEIIIEGFNEIEEQVYDAECRINKQLHDINDANTEIQKDIQAFQVRHIQDTYTIKQAQLDLEQRISALHHDHFFDLQKQLYNLEHTMQGRLFAHEVKMRATMYAQARKIRAEIAQSTQRIIQQHEQHINSSTQEIQKNINCLGIQTHIEQQHIATGLNSLMAELPLMMAQHTQHTDTQIAIMLQALTQQQSIALANTLKEDPVYYESYMQTRIPITEYVPIAQAETPNITLENPSYNEQAATAIRKKKEKFTNKSMAFKEQSEQQYKELLLKQQQERAHLQEALEIHIQQAKQKHDLLLQSDIQSLNHYTVSTSSPVQAIPRVPIEKKPNLLQQWWLYLTRWHTIEQSHSSH